MVSGTLELSIKKLDLGKKANAKLKALGIKYIQRKLGEGRGDLELTQIEGKKLYFEYVPFHNLKDEHVERLKGKILAVVHLFNITGQDWNKEVKKNEKRKKANN